MHIKSISFFILFFTSCLSVSLQATSVRSITIEQAMQESEFVFEGKVISRESVKSDNQRMILTQVTFEVTEVIKGTAPGKNIQLEFLGGKIDEQVLQVGEMQYPELGEKGIYFVESLTDQQVHPLYGWKQGHYLVVPDAGGVERVTTADKKPLTGMEKKAHKVSPSIQYLSTGTAIGLSVDSSSSLSSAMSSASFKQAIRSMGE